MGGPVMTPMPVQLWNNVECWFETENTHNNLGNSQYFITETGMTRAAFVNAGPHRNAEEVVFENVKRKVCYSSSDLSTHVHEAKEVRVLRVEVAGPYRIELQVTQKDGSVTVHIPYIRPEVGYYPFDGLIHPNGIYRKWHPGHQIISLKTGAQLKGQDLADAKAKGIALAKLCSYQANVFGPLQAPLTLLGGLTGKSGNRRPK
jgi:hypothetical protein